jgi:hypothetical protein
LRQPQRQKLLDPISRQPAWFELVELSAVQLTDNAEQQTHPVTVQPIRVGVPTCRGRASGALATVKSASPTGAEAR